MIANIISKIDIKLILVVAATLAVYFAVVYLISRFGGRDVSLPVPKIPDNPIIVSRIELPEGQKSAISLIEQWIKDRDFDFAKAKEKVLQKWKEAARSTVLDWESQSMECIDSSRLFKDKKMALFEEKKKDVRRAFDRKWNKVKSDSYKIFEFDFVRADAGKNRGTIVEEKKRFDISEIVEIANRANNSEDRDGAV